MARDRRLAAALALFAIASMSAAYQAIVIAHWMSAAVLGGWDQFVEIYSVDLPAAGPNEFCFDWCAPELPFTAGWLAIGCFVAGLALVAFAWWRPKP